MIRITIAMVTIAILMLAITVVIVVIVIMTAMPSSTLAFPFSIMLLVAFHHSQF